MSAAKSAKHSTPAKPSTPAAKTSVKASATKPGATKTPAPTKATFVVKTAKQALPTSKSGGKPVHNAPAKPAAKTVPAAKPVAKSVATKGSAPAHHVPILGIEGIGPKFEAKLKKAGVKNSAQLMVADVKTVSAKTEIPEAQVRLWKSMSILLPVKGVGPQFAEVLARTGIQSVKDLASCDPKKLSERINAVLDAKAVTITGATVTPKRVEAWIEAAGKLVGPIATPKPTAARKAGKLVVTERQDQATPLKPGRKASKIAAEIQAAGSNALPKPMKVRQQHPEIKENQGGDLAWAEEAFWAFFGDEIETMTSMDAEIFNDRSYAWRCECCDVALRVPRRTTVFHGDFEIVHDDNEGLLVNGIRHVPGAYTPNLQVVQPGRLRNPWTNKLIEGKDLGTSGVHAR